MSIPEPKFEITAFKLSKMFESMGYNWRLEYKTHVRYMNDLTELCYKYLDTI